MQKGPSQVTSGNIAPAISGPVRKDKEVIIVSGLVVILAAVIGVFWYYSSTDHPSSTSQEKLNTSQVSEVLKSSNPPATPVSLESHEIQAPPIGAVNPVVIHTDLYFELGRKGLTDEATAVLKEQAVILKEHPDMGVLVQGYTDQQGSSTYNLALGMKRADTVKQELIKAGVAEHQIKAVSLGEAGVLCIDRSDACRQMNRRVHLEIRTIGLEHMVEPVAESSAPTAEVLPAVDTTLEVGTTPASIDSEQQSDDSDSVIDNLVPSANASEPKGPTPVPFDPESGS